jgi:hypothetical protein
VGFKPAAWVLAKATGRGRAGRIAANSALCVPLSVYTENRCKPLAAGSFEQHSEARDGSTPYSRQGAALMKGLEKNNRLTKLDLAA